MYDSAVTTKARRRAAVSARSTDYAYPWVSDQQDGTYCNPVLYADYPDPDVIRVGEDFYMVVSSFHVAPGLPILHSRDLVNWTIVNHALPALPPRYNTVQPGCGVWAPSIRKRAGKFYIFFGMPDEGIFFTRAAHPEGPWSEPILVQPGKGLIDPCPLWDDDGNAYLVHAYANSRAGIKHKLRVRPMAPDCSRLLGEGEIVFDQPERHPTAEGPKFLKRDGYYYILAPAGGVEEGWQLALRSRHIFGPYEEKVILEQGSTPTNGPHQGALVDAPDGRWWFVHFQDAKPYGRILHVQPARWEDGWPLIGVDHDRNGIGEPVARHAMPRLPASRSNGAAKSRGHHRPAAPATTDHFLLPELGRQWHWNGNHQPDWFSLTHRPGWLRLYHQPATPADNTHPDGAPQPDLSRTPAVLMQKFPARSFSVDTLVDPHAMLPHRHAGLAIMGREWAAVDLRQNAKTAQPEIALLINGVAHFRAPLPHCPVLLRINVAPGGLCTFSYQPSGHSEANIPHSFTAVAGMWVGAKIGLYAVTSGPGSSTTRLPTSDRVSGRSFTDFNYLQFHAMPGA